MDNAPNPPEISAWIRQLQFGLPGGIEEAWTRFFDKLVRQVKQAPRPHGPAFDTEAVVASVFESAWRASQEGRLASIQNCDELWWWLLTITEFKTVDHTRRANKKSSGGGRIHVPVDEQLMSLISREPNPEYCTILNEEYLEFLRLLDDGILVEIAVMRMEGYSNREIEARTQLAPATVTRKLRIIRKMLEQRAKEMK